MPKDQISKILKDYRKRNHMSVEDVTISLKSRNLKFSEKTIYGWENGTSLPDFNVLLTLCEIYHIRDVLGTFGYTTPQTLLLSEHESQLVSQYRKLDSMQAAVDKLLGIDSSEDTENE